MAAQVVLALQTIRSRTLPPFEPSVVTVGIVRGGERFNIIPGEVHLEGTVRTYSDTRVDGGAADARDPRRRDRGRRRRVTSSTTSRTRPPTVNDPARRPGLARCSSARRALPTCSVAPPTMGGEDFSYFAHEVPGFYFRLGVVKPGHAVRAISHAHLPRRRQRAPGRYPGDDRVWCSRTSKAAGRVESSRANRPQWNPSAARRVRTARGCAGNPTL